MDTSLFPPLFFDWRAKGFLRFRALGGLAMPSLSGSGQFSCDTLQQILATAHGKLKIIDLREETHLFINGQPVSFRDEKNQANRFLPLDQILEQENRLAHHLRQQKYVLIHPLEEKEGRQSARLTKARRLEIQTVWTEQEVCRFHQIEYKRIPITDRCCITHQAAEQALLEWENKEGRHLHFHCKGGSGRTTTCLTLIDCLVHASKLPIDAILERQAHMGGRDLRQLPDLAAWNYPHALERLHFVHRFFTQQRLMTSPLPPIN